MEHKMKYLALGLVAICTVLMASESTMAVVVGGGGGKSSNKARFCFESLERGAVRNRSGKINEGCTVACWVQTSSAARPRTLGNFQNELHFVEPGANFKTQNLKAGSYQVSYFDANYLSQMGFKDDHVFTQQEWDKIVENMTYNQRHNLQGGSDIHIPVRCSQPIQTSGPNKD